MDELLKYVPGRSISSEPYPFYHFSYDVKGNKRGGRYEYTKPVIKTPTEFKCYKCGKPFKWKAELALHHREAHGLTGPKNLKELKKEVAMRESQSRRDRRAEAERRQQLLLMECGSCHLKYTTKEDRSNWKGETYTKCPRCGRGHIIRREHGRYVGRPTPA